MVCNDEVLLKEINMNGILEMRQTNDSMSVIDAIYLRQAVRDYKADKLDESTMLDLMNAAVHAPSAMDEEPWAFVIVQDKSVLNRISDNTKKLMQSGFETNKIKAHSLAQENFLVSEFNVFYNAPTLVIICAKPVGEFVDSDCWLAAQNLMLAACAKKIGSCIIGMAVSILNTPKWKDELGIPNDMTAYVPIILGIPNKETAIKPRKPVNILAWK
jgi:nitroreductase